MEFANNEATIDTRRKVKLNLWIMFCKLLQDIRMVFWICEDSWEHILTSGCTKVDARLTRDTFTTNYAPTEHARAAGSSGCDQQNEDHC